MPSISGIPVQQPPYDPDGSSGSYGSSGSDGMDVFLKPLWSPEMDTDERPLAQVSGKVPENTYFFMKGEGNTLWCYNLHLEFYGYGYFVDKGEDPNPENRDYAQQIVNFQYAPEGIGGRGGLMYGMGEYAPHFTRRGDIDKAKIAWMGGTANWSAGQFGQKNTTRDGSSSSEYRSNNQSNHTFLQVLAFC